MPYEQAVLVDKRVRILMTDEHLSLEKLPKLHDGRRPVDLVGYSTERS